VLGLEVAGVVESVAPGVTGLAPGDRVAGACKFGGYAELAVSAEADVVRLPDDWSFEEGAAVPVSYGAAYAGLLHYGPLRSGDRVLIHSAGGGVGVAATQLAKLHGAEVFGTASSHKHDAIRELGVDHPIDYRGCDFVAEIRRLAGSRQPLDVAMDPIGGRSWRRSLSLLGPGGRLVCYGASAAVGGQRRNVLTALRTLVETPRFNALRLTMQSRGVIGIDLGAVWERKGTLVELTEPLGQLMRAGSIKPVVAESFALARGADAHRFIQDRRNVGKVVLAI
jgi:NADPH:quinone reductase-like Zn-dependent oxidoreductase